MPKADIQTKVITVVSIKDWEKKIDVTCKDGEMWQAWKNDYETKEPNAWLSAIYPGQTLSVEYGSKVYKDKIIRTIFNAVAVGETASKPAPGPAKTVHAAPVSSAHNFNDDIQNTICRQNALTNAIKACEIGGTMEHLNKWLQQFSDWNIHGILPGEKK